MILNEDFGNQSYLSHNLGCNCEACTVGIDSVKQQQQKLMETIGWYAHMIANDPEHPFNVNYHTHGIPESFKHKNFQVCFPMRMDTIHTIITHLVDRVKNGEVFYPGQILKDVLKSTSDTEMPITFLDITIKDEKCLRVIFPDENGEVLKEKISDQYTPQWNK